MSVWDLDGLKLRLMNSIRTHAYPYQSNYDSSISINSCNGTISQTLVLFSDSISSYGIYISELVGSPPPMTISLYNGGSVKSSSTITGTVGWNITSYSTTDLRTSSSSSLVVTCGGATSIDDYMIGKADTITYFYGNAGTFNTAFTIGIKDFVYKVFPAVDIDANRTPVANVDINGRPSIQDKYLSGDAMWMILTARTEVYGKTPSEVDKLIGGIDRGMTKFGRTFDTNTYLHPGDLGDLQYIRAGLYTRQVTWNLRRLIVRQ